jgi:hypothetical protein
MSNNAYLDYNWTVSASLGLYASRIKNTGGVKVVKVTSIGMISKFGYQSGNKANAIVGTLKITVKKAVYSLSPLGLCTSQSNFPSIALHSGIGKCKKVWSDIQSLAKTNGIYVSVILYFLFAIVCCQTIIQPIMIYEYINLRNRTCSLILMACY